MQPKAKQLDSLTGLRFIAAFAVFAHHMSGKFGFPNLHLALGTLGVSFFFVLSGFILTYVYNGRLEKGGIKRFYFTRWARIWPLHLATLLLILFYVGRWFTGFDPAVLFCNVTLLQSWIPLKEFIFSMNGVSWSISTEMFFYLMFPFLLIGGQRKFWYKFAIITVLIALTLFVCQSLARVPAFAEKINFLRIPHVNPFIRLFEFCAGMGVGFLYLNRKSDISKQRVGVDTFWELVAIAAIALFAIAIGRIKIHGMVESASWGGVVYGGWVRFGSGGIVFAYAIYLFATRRGLLTRWLSSRVMVFLGEISFAFYMVHMIVIRQINRHDWIGAHIPDWAIVGCVLAISLCASVVLYKVVEIPCKSALLKMYDRKWSDSLGILAKSPVNFLRNRSGVATVAIMVLAMGALDIGYRHPAFPPEVRDVLVKSNGLHGRVDFLSIARMRGAEATRTPDGIELKIAWQKIHSSELKRFVHICDANGKVLASKQRVLQPLHELKIGDMFVDTLLIESDKLSSDAAFIGVGFFTQGKGLGELKKNKRTTGTWRYTVLDHQELATLVSSSVATTADLKSATNVQSK